MEYSNDEDAKAAFALFKSVPGYCPRLEQGKSSYVHCTSKNSITALRSMARKHRILEVKSPEKAGSSRIPPKRPTK